MSFDVYFVRADVAGFDSSTSTGANDGSGRLSAAEWQWWEQIVDQVGSRLGDVEVERSDAYCEITELELGLQVCLFPGELVLSLPYWYEDEAAVEMAKLLNEVAGVIESITGLAAYDPQSSTLFLANDARSVGDGLTEVRGAVDALASEPRPADGPSKRRWFRRRP